MHEARLGRSGIYRFSANASHVLAAAVGCWLLSTTTAPAQNVIAYPAQGQSADQQSRDRYECHVWAVQQSGFDPSRQVAQAGPPVTTSPLQGAARGATVGVVGGAIAGNAGKGAAIGAATGALLGGIRRHEQRQQQAYYQAQAGSGSSYYDRALKTCLQGRGYTAN